MTDDDAARPLLAAVMMHRAIRSAAAAWRAMNGAMLTLGDLATALSVSTRTARRHIARLAAYGLAVSDGRAYTAAGGVDVIERAAEMLGIAARRDKRAAEITAERDRLTARLHNRRNARDRAQATRMLTARVRAHKIDMTRTPTAPQGRTAPPMTPQGLTHPPTPNGGRTGDPDAIAPAPIPPNIDNAVTLAVGDATLTTSADTLATLTAAHTAGISAAVDGLRAGDGSLTAAAGLFGQPVAVAAPSTAAAP